jgi:four helix bundle protein
LEDRTYRFALRVRRFLKLLPRSLIAEVDGRQLVRSSGSVGANYIEANESVGDRDFLYRIKLCKKEAKESRYWLQLLLLEEAAPLALERAALAAEADELTRIFAAIHRNSAAKGPAGTT